MISDDDNDDDSDDDFDYLGYYNDIDVFQPMR